VAFKGRGKRGRASLTGGKGRGKTVSADLREEKEGDLFYAVVPAEILVQSGSWPRGEKGGEELVTLSENGGRRGGGRENVHCQKEREGEERLFACIF